VNTDITVARQHNILISTRAAAVVAMLSRAARPALRATAAPSLRYVTKRATRKPPSPMDEEGKQKRPLKYTDQPLRM
jgi:hypothetical protein